MISKCSTKFILCNISHKFYMVWYTLVMIKLWQNKVWTFIYIFTCTVADENRWSIVLAAYCIWLRRSNLHHSEIKATGGRSRGLILQSSCLRISYRGRRGSVYLSGGQQVWVQSPVRKRVCYSCCVYNANALLCTFCYIWNKIQAVCPWL